jgi:thiol-disulfide isomerase/thioredoxin
MSARRTLLWSVFVPVALALAVTARGAARQPIDGSIPGIDGRTLNPFAPAGTANVIFFVATDCPISNSYAPEIQRVCQEYGPRGVACSLMYEDVDTASSATALDDEVRSHLQEYRYAGIPAAVDRARIIATRAKAKVTPQAVVIDRAGAIRYRGRIDNFYAAFGKPRQQVTERDLRDALDAVLSGQPVPKIETEALGCYIVDPALLRK